MGTHHCEITNLNWSINNQLSWCHEIMVLLVLHKLNSSNTHAQPSSGAGYLIFGQTLPLLPYFMCANSEGSGETAWMRRLAWALAGRLCDKYHISWAGSIIRWQNHNNKFDNFYLILTGFSIPLQVHVYTNSCIPYKVFRGFHLFWIFPSYNRRFKDDLVYDCQDVIDGSRTKHFLIKSVLISA